MELYNSSIFRNKYIFFELCEGTYLHIDKKAIGSQNAIYFFERKIANSLEIFLLCFNTEGHYFEYDWIWRYCILITQVRDKISMQIVLTALIFRHKQVVLQVYCQKSNRQ